MHQIRGMSGKRRVPTPVPPPLDVRQAIAGFAVRRGTGTSRTAASVSL